ncbi:hypothetical protein C8F04DRAFT_1228295 [Mycena alexandri]|uniref:F-box domain-containing protein n=1 Tax=Mycena alexandri TaxID=1745969 RepID=A0AAD6TEW6_9AGAR|nr:hypothetical protein C8F04DRAFT_1228295 [Mycena alexandri]
MPMASSSNHLTPFSLLMEFLDPTLKSEVNFDGNFVDVDAQYFNPFTALRFALFIPNLQNFSATFNASTSSDITRIARGIRSCHRIVNKFPSIRNVAVEFQAIAYDARFLPSGGMNDLLKSDFQALLDTIADLPHLESLRIATGWHFDSAYMLELFPSVKPIHPPSQPTTASSLFKKPSKLYKNLFPRRTPERTAAAAPTQRTPMTFSIDTPILILPAFYPRTMSILGSRPITALRLHMLIAPMDWGTILPEIVQTVPHLAELTILGVRMPVPALIESISALHQLTLLTMDSAPDFISPPSFRAIPTPPLNSEVVSTPQSRLIMTAYLQNLTTLAVRPEHLDALLYPHNPLPALKILCLRVELLDLNSPGTSLLMRKIVHRLRATHKSLPLTFDVRANIAPEALMCRTLDIALSQGQTWDDAFGSIEHLRVRDYGEFSCAVLARWGTVFRGARKISLSGLASSSSERIIAEIHRTCPEVQTVTVDGFIEAEVGRWADTFLELPDDVLLIIFQHLGPELYALARLSRRLNLLALPVYLAQSGVPNPPELCEFRLVNHPMGGDVLSALSSAVYITQTKHLSCEFTSGGNVSCYLNHIERLTSFIRKLSSIDQVSLSLVDLGNVDSEVNELVRQRWRRTFEVLLNVVLERSCTSLTIRGAPYLKPDLSESARLVSGSTIELSALAQTNSSIHTFSFHPLTTLSHFGIRWTFSALRSSHISILIVFCSDFLDLKLVELLGKLPALTRLSLPFKADLHGNRPFVSDRIIPSLPNLRSLTTAAPFLLHFLLAENALPVLENLEIRTSAAAALPSKWSLARVLSALKERGPKLPPVITLELTLAHRQFELWLRSGGFRALIGTEVAWGEASKLINSLHLRWSIGYGVKIDACERILQAVLPHFPFLSSLSVDDGTGHEMAAQASVLALILETYPDIRSVTLNNFPVALE